MLVIMNFRRMLMQPAIVINETRHMRLESTWPYLVGTGGSTLAFVTALAVVALFKLRRGAALSAGSLLLSPQTHGVSVPCKCSSAWRICWAFPVARRR